MNICTDSNTQPFWQATQDGRLLIQRCPVTGQYQWFPRGHSLYAPESKPEWVEASGRGKVFSFSVVYRTTGSMSTPFVCALVELEEGILMLTHLVGSEVDNLRIGAEVRVEFKESDSEYPLPVFRVN